jgi:hypothetical protein
MPSEFSRVVEAGCDRSVGQPKGRPPFYCTSAPIITPVTSKFTFFIPTTTSHNGKILKG